MKDAARLEMRADQLYTASEVAKLLGIGRSTFYTLAWFKTKKVRVTRRVVRYAASDIQLFQQLQRGA
jgi:predicted DNA-binding transcriptional regulator AlpA